MSLIGAVEDGIITDSKTKEKIDTFIKHDWKFRKRERTTKEEIYMINQILEDVTALLEKL